MKKKILILSFSLIFSILITSCGVNNEKNAEIITTESNDYSISDNSEIDTFIEDVNNVIQDNVGENETIDNVTLENNDLHIFVDLSQAEPTIITLEDLALLRTSYITDAILDLYQYDDLWDTITVDFGDIGEVKNNKNDIEENEYGMRYFPEESFVLE